MTSEKMMEITEKYWKDKGSKSLFCLIMIEEIQRMCKEQSICEFYRGVMQKKKELELQLICTDAALSRGSLAYAEKILIRDGIATSYNALKESKRPEDGSLFKKLEAYYFWDTTYAIYMYLREVCVSRYKNGTYGDMLNELKNRALSGELDEVIKDLESKFDEANSETLNGREQNDI